MARSARVRATDELAVVRLVAECRESGADAGAWQAHLVAGLLRLTDGTVAGVGASPRGVPTLEMAGQFAAGITDGGWPSEASRVRFRAWLKDPAAVARQPGLPAFMATPGAIVARTRQELVADDEWDRSEFVNDELRARGFDEGMIARCPTATGPTYLVTVMRSVGERPFDSRVGRVVGRLLTELAPHLGRALWLTTQPHVGELTPRRRQVLDGLLDGDSEKQVARRLGLHAATVHDHVKAIYTHFGVTTRAELLALFLRRHRSPG